MIVIFAIIDWHIQCSQTLCFPLQCPGRAISVHRCMAQILIGPECTQWHPEVKDMKLCHCCLWGTMSCQLIDMTMQRKWSKVSSMRSSKMLHVSWNNWSHTLPLQMMLNERFKHLKNELVISCFGPGHQCTWGTTALSWKPISGPILSMIFINRMGNTWDSDIGKNIRYQSVLQTRVVTVDYLLWWNTPLPRRYA